MDDSEIARKAYPNTRNGNGGRGGRPKGSKNAKGHVVAKIIDNCRSVIEKEVQRITKAVLSEEGRIAFSDIRQLFNVEGNPLLPHQIPDSIAPAIRSIRHSVKTIPRKDEEPVTVTICEYTLWDKGSALERLSKTIGLYRIDNEQKPPPQVNTQINYFKIDDFTEEELRLALRMGGKVDGDRLALPETVECKVETAK